MTRSVDMQSMATWWPRVASVATATLLAACGGGGGGGEVTASGEGTLRVALTDAPSCGFDNVFVTVEKVRVHTSSSAADADAGWRDINVSPARRIDLLTLTNGVLAELGSTPLPAGNYSQIRLVLTDNSSAAPLANAVKPTGGAEVALRTPSAQQSGLKLQSNFTVESGQQADLVLDFDACKSVVRAGNSGAYNLKPVVSVAPRLSSGIQGYVSTTLSLNGTTVSAQQNGTVIRSTVPDTTGKFVLAFLQPGSYDVVVTSEGRSTAVVSSVPVTTATASITTVNGTATAIVPPVSTMRELTGTSSVATTGTATATLVTDANVTVRQTVGTSTVHIAQVPVNADLATYRFTLPTAAPVRAPYAATGPLAFTADTAAAGKYTLVGTAPGRTTLQQAIDFATLVGTTSDLRFAP
jgi:hypothetical protein